MDPMRGTEPQRPPSVLPGAAGAGTAVDHDLIDTAPHSVTLELVGHRETGLTCTDHDHVDSRGYSDHGHPPPLARAPTTILP